MLHLLSSGQSTQLHSFTDLSTQFTYAHVNSDRQDFHHAPEANLFVATVPTFGFELMRRNVKACTPSAVAATAAAATALGDPLQRVRKVLLSEISYVACSYGRAPDLAIGRSNGAIHIYNLKRAELSSVRFRHDSARHSVVNLAYNRSNELLAGVFANTDVVLYGMQTGVKMHVFELDRGWVCIDLCVCVCVCTFYGIVMCEPDNFQLHSGSVPSDGAPHGRHCVRTRRRHRARCAHQTGIVSRPGRPQQPVSGRLLVSQRSQYAAQRRLRLPAERVRCAPEAGRPAHAAHDAVLVRCAGEKRRRRRWRSVRGGRYAEGRSVRLRFASARRNVGRSQGRLQFASGARCILGR